MNDPEARSAASKALGVAADASPAQVRSTFLNRLAQGEFAAQPAQLEAAALLGAITGIVGPRWALDRETEKHLAGRIEEFAASYWSYDPAKRRENWEILMQASESFPRLAGRLSDLDQGLDVVLPNSYAEPWDGALAAAIAELYPLKPATRAARRVRLLDETGSPAQLRTAAKSLWKSASPVSRIDHGLLNTLADRDSSVPVIRKLSRSEPEDSSAPAKPKKSQYQWLLIIPIAIGVIGGIARNSNSTKDSSSLSAPRSKLNSSRYLVADPENPGSEALQTLMGSKRILYELIRLSPRQHETFRKLFALESLSKEQSNVFAATFVKDRLSSPLTIPDEKVEQAWQLFVEKELTAHQRDVVKQLTKGYWAIEDIARALLYFVAMGPNGKVDADNFRK